MRSTRLHRGPFGRVWIRAASWHEADQRCRRPEWPTPQQQTWHRYFPEDLRALAGSPPETFCLLPDPADLIELDGNWPEPDRDKAALVSLTIGCAFDLAQRQLPWLNCWSDDHPVSLWHFSHRFSQGIKPLNGGTMGMRFVWSVFNADGSVCSCRTSRGPLSATPCGHSLARFNGSWTFTEHPWSPRSESDVTVSDSIDERDLPVPRSLEAPQSSQVDANHQEGLDDR